MSRISTRPLDLGELEPLEPDPLEPLPPWRRRLIDDLMRGCAASEMHSARRDARHDGATHDDATHGPAEPVEAMRGDELLDFGAAIAHEQVEVLAHQLLGGDLSLWASARGDADRAAALRAIECDLLAQVHHEVEVARARVLQIAGRAAVGTAEPRPAHSPDLPR